MNEQASPPVAGPVADIASLVTMQRRRPWWLIGAGIGLVLTTAVGIWWYLSSGTTATVAPVQTAEVTRGQIASVLSTSGSASPVLQTKLTFNASGSTTVTGIVSSVDVKVGDRVTQGQRLATLDSRNVQRTLQQAQARTTSERIRLEQFSLTLPQNAAAAAQAVTAAQAQLQRSLNDLAALEHSPTYAQDLAAARQAALSAQTAATTSQQALDLLLSRVDSADQATATERRIDDLNTQRAAAEVALQQVADATGAPYFAAARTSLVAAARSLCSRPENLTGCLGAATAASNVPELIAAITANAPGSPDLRSEWNEFVRITGPSADVSALVFRELQAVTALPGLRDHANALARSLSLAGVPGEDAVANARTARDAAASGLLAAQTRLDAVIAGPTAANLQDAQNAVASARAAVDAAVSKQAALGGQENSNYALQQQQVLLSEIALQQAQDAVDDGTLKAPFAGVIGAVTINPGDLVAPSTVAITLTDPDRITVQLTVSEADLPGLGSGQLGIATFDALPQRTFVVRTTGVSNIPTVTQGVVTYQAQAEIVTGDALRGAGNEVIELLRIRGLLRENQTPADATALIDRLAAQALPAPGMNASVSIVEQIVADAVLVPSAAVRRQGQQNVVVVLTGDSQQQSVNVSVGVTDGTSVAITSTVQPGERVVVSGLTTAATPQSGQGGIFGPGGVR